MGSEGQNRTQGTYDSFFKNVITTQVLPAKAASSVQQQHPESVNPSHLDHLHMDRYVPLLFGYGLPNNTDETYQAFVSQLKSSLSQVLVLYYPMAGRVLHSDDLDHPRQLLFNDIGVPFTEAFCDERMEITLGLPDFQPVGFLSGFEPAGLDPSKQVQGFRDGGNPPMFVQVTRFNCGGVIVAFTWNHIMADMTGAMQFMTAWSEISRLGSTKLEPDHNRSLLCAPPKSQTASSSSGLDPPAQSPEETAKIQNVLNAKYNLRVLPIRKESIDKVKREALLLHPEVSTMDCLCAHLWRNLAKVNAALGVTQVTAFTTAVEGRSRLGVSPTYFGNAVASAPIMGVPALDITSRPLAYSASLIRKAIRGTTKDTYWSLIDQMDLRNPWKTSINRTDHQLGLTSWIRFGLNDLDFGIGKPAVVLVNLLTQNARKGQCMVLPRGEDFSVMLYLAPNVIQALWMDPDFMSLS